MSYTISDRLGSITCVNLTVFYDDVVQMTTAPVIQQIRQELFSGYQKINNVSIYHLIMFQYVHFDKNGKNRFQNKTVNFWKAVYVQHVTY